MLNTMLKCLTAPPFTAMIKTTLYKTVHFLNLRKHFFRTEK